MLETAAAEQKHLEQEPITVKITFSEKSYKFHLRMISISEESQLRQRFSKLDEVTDEVEKAAMNYSINREALAKFAVSTPETNENEQSGDPSQATINFFAEVSPLKERIAEYAIRGFLTKLTPDISFL